MNNRIPNSHGVLAFEKDVIRHFGFPLAKLVTWVCLSGTHGLVYRVWPIMEVDKYKDSKIDLETKKENPIRIRLGHL
jgi:hypothetical protein